MSSKTDPINKKILTHHHPPAASSFRLNLRRRSRNLPTVRLGGKKPRCGSSLLRLCKKAKQKVSKLKYLSTLKELKNHYKTMVKDMMKGSGKTESLQQRLLLETSFVVSVLGLAFNTHPSSHQRR